MLRFRLRTLLIVVGVVAVPCAWVGWQLDWIRQRRTARQAAAIRGVYRDKIDAPSMLWIFGERGERILLCAPENAHRLKELFPEADIREFGPVIEQP